MDRVGAWWQPRWLQIGAIVLVAVVLVLIGGSYVIMHQTDSVSVTAQYWIGQKTTPDRAYATAIHDSAPAHRVHAIFDAPRPLHSSGAGIACNRPAYPYYLYEFVFTWRGRTTESVRWSTQNCAFSGITAWGIPSTQAYAALGLDQFHELAQLTGIPLDLRYQ